MSAPFKLGRASCEESGQARGCCRAAATNRPGSPGSVAQAGLLSTASSGLCQVANCLWALRSLAIKQQHGQHADISAIPPESNKLTLFGPCDLPNDLDDHLPQSLSGALRTSSSVVWGHTPGKTSNPPEKLQEKGALSTLPSHPDGSKLHRAILSLTSPPDPEASPAGSLWGRPGCKTTAALTD